MAVPFVRVQPGDLVASDLFNRLLDAFEALDRRVAVLEGSPGVGEVGITGVRPASGAVKVGDPLKVFGFGFGFTLGACRAFVDGDEVVTFLPGSNDTELNLVIPAGAAGPDPIPPAGRPVPLVVRGPRGEARWPLTLMPAPAGGPSVLLGFAGADQLRPGQPARLRFSARSMIAADQTVTLSASFSGVADPAAWLAAASLDSAPGSPLPGGRLSLRGNEPGKEFGLALSAVPPPGAGDAAVTVVVTAAGADGPAGASGANTLPIGQPIPDVGIVLVGPAPQGGTADGGVLTVPPGQAAFVRYTATFTRAGTYQVRDPQVGGAAGWAVTRSSDATVVGDPAPGGSKVLQYLVTAPPAGAGDGTVVFPVANDAGAVDRTKTLTLRLRR